jgi:phage gpG-like protein
MISIKYSINDMEAKTGLKELSKRLTNPQQALRECGLVLLRSISKTFKAGGRPVRWQPSARAKMSGGRTMIKTARLLRSITMDVSGKTLTVGTNVKYAGILHEGGTIRPKTAKALKFNIPGIGWRTMKKVTIPARPFLVVQDADWRILNRIFEDYLTK